MIDVITILNHPMSNELGKSILFWIIKNLFTKHLEKRKKAKEEVNLYEEVIEITINEFKEDVNITVENFDALLTNELIVINFNEFENGDNGISEELLTNVFCNIVFSNDEINNIAISRRVIKRFLSNCNSYISTNPTYAFQYIISLLVIQNKNSTKYSQELVGMLENIKDSLSDNYKNIENKLELIQEQNTQTQNMISRHFTDLPNNNKNSDLNDLIDSANKLYKEGRIITARNIYLVILDKVDKNDKETYWRLNKNIALTYMNDFGEKEAIKYFYNAYSVYPEIEKGKVLLAQARLIEKNYDEGLRIVDELLIKNPNSSEIIQLKLNFLQLLNRVDEIFEYLISVEIDEKEILHTLGWILYRNRKYKEAEEKLRNSLVTERDPYIINLLSLVLLEPLVAKYQVQKTIFLDESNDEYLRLMDCLELSNEAINILEKREDQKELANAFFNRSIIYSVLHDLEKAKIDIEKAESLGLNNSVLFRNKGIYYLATDQLSSAITNFKKAVELGDDEANEYLIVSMMLNHDNVDAKSLLLSKIKYPDIKITSTNYTYYILLSEILENELEFENSEIILEEIKERFSNDIKVIHRVIENKRKNGLFEEAVNYLTEISNKKENNSETVELMLADLYYEIKDYEKASILYAKFKKYDSDNTLQKLLTSLVNLGKYKEGFKLCSEIENKLGNNIEFVEKVKGDLLFYAEKFSESKNIFEKLSTNYRKPQYYIKWGYSEFRLGNLDVSKKIIGSAEKDFYDNPIELIRISSAYNDIGETNKALNLAYRSLEKLPDNYEANINYFRIFLYHTQINPKDIIPDEKVKAYQSIVENYETKFPDKRFLQKIKVDNDLTEVKQILDAQESFFKQFNEIYDKHHIPISIAAKIIKRNIYITWSNLTANKERKIWAYDPNKFIFENNIVTNSSKVIIEPISFFLLNSLGVVELLDKVFDEYYFPQRLFDLVHYELTYLRMSERDGYFRTVSIEGEMYKEEISALEVGKQVFHYQNMLRLMKGKTIGNEFINDSNLDSDKVFDLMDDSSVQAIQFSIYNNITIISDEAILNNYFKDKYQSQYNCVSTLTILTLLKIRKVITTDDFNRYIIKLTLLKYYYIPIDANKIFFGIKENDFVLNEDSESIINYLHEPSIDNGTLAKVYAELFYMIYAEKRLPITQDKWLDYALDSVPQNNYNMTEVLKIINDYSKNKYSRMIQSVEYIRWLDSRLGTWAHVRGIPYVK